MNPKRLRSYIYLVIVAAIWGAAGPVIKFTLRELPPFTFLTYRFFITSLLLVPIMIASKEKFPKDSKKNLTLLVLSLLGTTVNLGFLFVGLKFTSVLDQTFISETGPIFIILASSIFLKDRITKRERVGIFITFIGTILLIIQPLIKNGFLAYNNLFGNILILLANVSWVGYVIISKKQLRQKVSPLTMTVSNFFVGFITLLPLAVLENHGAKNFVSVVSSVSFPTQLGVFYMAIISGALAYYLFQLGQKSIESSEAAIFSYLQPLFSTPLAIIWLKEEISSSFIISVIIIITGIIIAQYKKKSLAR
ncbi:DMT family transporter [Patescibacteria group bacterium]|nr:DMT family transporter [Patescibacteria group bacterium]MBU2036383.1 DMT family transporter [Patescibacteria group bacterium]